VYATAVASAPTGGGKRGPKTTLTDEELLGEIRTVLAACPFHSEGHRKVHFRLRAQGIRVGRKRVLRVMGAHHLLVPSRPRHAHGDPAHAGTIITTRPDEMWGTDATRFYTEREGWCWLFGAVDHYTTEIMGWHVAKIGDRWAALEPIIPNAACSNPLPPLPRAAETGAEVRVFPTPPSCTTQGKSAKRL
jgi:putative transposase